MTMRIFSTILLMLCGFVLLKGQTYVDDFENFNLTPDEYLDGSDGAGGFTGENIFLFNEYNSDYNSYLGWAISAMTDVSTQGFTNQYSAITGGGANGSDSYAVGYHFGANVISLKNRSVVDGFYITNSTFAYLSMRDGDSFAKRFGGEDGTDPDFFRVVFQAFKDGNLKQDTVEFYLADYRFANDQEDYLVSDWQWVDLSSLGACDSIQYFMDSSDKGAFGVNTPTYICIDNFTTRLDPTSSRNLNLLSNVEVYPNPAVNFVHFDWESEENAVYDLIGSNGKVLQRGLVQGGFNTIDLQGVYESVFYMRILSGETNQILGSKQLMKF
jgi:hypothetical protein